MLFRETVAVYCENHMEHKNTLFGQDNEIFNIEEGGTYSNHRALRGQWTLKLMVVQRFKYRRHTIRWSVW
jgi:hypothetical protein